MKEIKLDSPELREGLVSLLSRSLKGATYYNGEWLIGQDCHLEIPEQRKLANQFLALCEKQANEQMIENMVDLLERYANYIKDEHRYTYITYIHSLKEKLEEKK